MTEPFPQPGRDFLLSGVAKLASGRVAVLGDVMLDHYLLGRVERISPEAPVPVVCVEKDDFKLGGACNVAWNVRALGGEARLIGVVGNDEYGRTLETLCRECGVAADLITDVSRNTTVKSRIMAQQQQMVRIDRETTANLAFEIHTVLLDRLSEHLREIDLLVLSDYGKGVITPDFLHRIMHLEAVASGRVKVCVDPKVRHFSAYKNVYCLTPNRMEASLGSGAPIDSMNQVADAGRIIFDTLRCEHLLITLGSLGMALFESPHRAVHIPTTARRVYDVTGAGDTVIAVMALAVSAGLSLLEACVIANFAAGLVVAQVGAAAVTCAELAEAVRTLPLPSIAPLQRN